MFAVMLIRLRIIPPATALPNPAISKPGTSPAVKYRRKPLITNVKRPSVKIFTGNVRIIIAGFITAFNTPRIKAAAIKAADP